MTSLFDILLAIGIFVISMLIVILLRKRIGKELEIKNTDILIGIIPLALWLLLSGKISSFEYGDLKIVTAFQKANNNPISEAITNIYRQDIDELEKSSIYKLETILSSKPDALVFYAGKNIYSDEITKEYLIRLSKSTLKFLLIKNTNKKFIGVISVDRFMSQSMVDTPSFSIRQFVNWLNSGNSKKIKNISGMLSIKESVQPSTSKQEALSKMQELSSKFLPVVQNEDFKGIIEMEKLSTSLLMDISRAINEVN